MLKYEEKKQYFLYSELPLEEKKIYYNLIKRFVRKVAWEYIGFWNWYESLFLANYELKCTREIIICEKDLQLAGISILKRELDEQKICTLRVAKRFQKQGIGKNLVEYSCEWLQNNQPLITVHKSRNNEFKSLFDYYGFTLEEKQKNYYNLFNTELVYNGTLPRRGNLVDLEEIIDFEVILKRFLSSGQQDFKSYMENFIHQWWDKERIRESLIKGY